MSALEQGAGQRRPYMKWSARAWLEQGAGQRRPYMKQGRPGRGRDLWERAESPISCRGAAGLRPGPHFV